jgi:hypothetical protein
VKRRPLRRWLSFATIVIAAAVLSSCMGRWDVDTNSAPVRGIHVALLPTGKVLLVAGSGNDWRAFDAGSFKSALWDPVTRSFEDIATPNDLFCSGHAFLPDGRLLVNGGTTSYGSEATQFNSTGLNETWIFDPQTKQYDQAANMSIGRWYPTVTELGNGHLFTVGGFDEVGQRSEQSEVFNGSAWVNQQPMPSAMVDMPLYPSLHLLRDGRLFYSGAQTFSGVTGPPGLWDIDANEFTPVSGLTDPQSRDQGMSVLLPPESDQKVMIIGGGNHFNTAVTPVSSTAIIDLDAPDPSYVSGPPIDQPKMYVSAVILPDSTVLQTGGASTSVVLGDNPVNTAQIYDPKTNKWKNVAAPTIGRNYHSSAILLPDATVATFGGNVPQDNTFEFRIERFTPPYLQTGTPRPTITSAPTQVHYGEQHTITTTQSSALRSVVLVRPMAATHSGEPNQRLVDLDFTSGTDGTSISLPSSGNAAPPGWYMMFVVDTKGVPSVASWVHLT